jgi:hypothetical protein
VKEFHAWFPDAIELRHAAAHAGEFGTPTKIPEHMILGLYEDASISVAAGASVFTSDEIANDVYSSSYEGRVVQLPMTSISAQRIESVRRKVIHAFTRFVSKEV